MATSFGGELDADAQGWFDSQLFAPLHDERQLRGHFQDEDDVQPGLFGLQCEVDELRILVAVANEEGLPVVHEGQRGEQFRLGAHFDAIVVLFAILGHFLDHLLLLVDFDRIDAAVTALVALVAHFLAEGFVQFLDAGIKQIGKTKEGREMEVLVLLHHAADNLRQGDLGKVATVLEPDRNFSRLVAAEITISPSGQPIEFQ